ncbi:hypothetical protein FNV43_RR09878 [Rhamnella rubrinervis]|uniref:Beta-glucosidase 12-like n=1 Tax=Rhamnella rubrinervis TaxID=2594499 RepID=A0A8K0MKS4_9ROSA|nr:hypothetical protein FNV43_RR09878 [Rhamnella rubrinervis]
MAFQGCILLGLLVLVSSAVTSSSKATIPPNYDTASLNRSSFPAGFIFGTASSAYQYEGAVREGGRGPSIWDTYSHQHPEKIKDGSNGDVAIDSYHRWKSKWGVNKEGINYYNNLINELIANGLKPFVTLFHWDLPQALEDEYGGFLSPHIVYLFREFAEVCYKEFGDRVKHWITFNEPLAYAFGGYASGMFPPGRCSSWQQLNCSAGDSGTEPYIATHHMLLAHAAAVELYKIKYQASQKGSIGITLVSPGLCHIRRQNTTEMLQCEHLISILDAERNGIPIGPKVSAKLTFISKGIRDLLLYIKTKYHNPLIYITENGVDEFNDPKLSLEEALVDNQRIDYHYRHLYYLRRAIKDGANVKGYFAWSLLDNFEWTSGYTVRFGINYVDYKMD